MTELNDRQRQAAEYVIGTLPHPEREAFARTLETDTELQTLVEEWEQRLAPLLDAIDEATPRADLLEKIKAQLPPVNAVKAQAPQQTAEIITLKQQLNNWRRAAIAATAIAAGLASVILFAPTTPIAPEPFVAVFQQDDQQPAFLMSVDLETQQLTVRAITAQGQLGKSYQLWIKADALGDKPLSLGLIDSLEQPTFKQIQYDPEVLQNALFGISVEPKGGSPTGQPTGPAIHGQLYPASI